MRDPRHPLKIMLEQFSLQLDKVRDIQKYEIFIVEQTHRGSNAGPSIRKTKARKTLERDDGSDICLHLHEEAFLKLQEHVKTFKQLLMFSITKFY
jgi:hypothetical protein